MRAKKLLKVGRTDVKSALGFFYRDGYKMYVAATPEDIDGYKRRGYTDQEFHPMSELESVFRNSSAMKYISWCSSIGSPAIVRQGASQVTFDYGTQKSVIHIR